MASTFQDESLSPPKMQTFLRSLVTNTNPVTEQRYLLGLRGVLVIETFIWMFLDTFVPAMVKDSAETDGPEYQHILRKTLSVLFWNDSLIFSAIIFLSARTICLPFFKNSTANTVAGACFRRALRLIPSVALAIVITKVSFTSSVVSRLVTFKNLTGHTALTVPYALPSALSTFNSIFSLFWTPYNFSQQAGSLAFPTQTLWVISALYSQSYTVYMTVVIIPYTRPAWRVEAFIVFILTAWWVQSWAWYTISGLFMADAVVNMDFKNRSKHGMPVWKTKLRIPIWVIWPLVLAAGLTMQYLWVAWRPQSANIELKGHTGLYYTGGLNTEYDIIQPQARDDNYLVILGGFLMLETVDWMQRALSWKGLVALGDRSLSYFLTAPLILYTLCIRVYLLLNDRQPSISPSANNAICLALALATTIPAAEIMHRFVDLPSRTLARLAWNWITTV